MKYTIDIDINRPRDRVIQLFDNPENMKHWQEGFVSFEPMSGTPGQPGAKSRLRYKMGNRDVELIETVIVRNLPEEFSGTYETQGMWNEVRNEFRSLDDQRTKWTSHVEFQATSFMMKTMMAMMPGAFKKRSGAMMQKFKEWAEAS